MKNGRACEARPIRFSRGGVGLRLLQAGGRGAVVLFVDLDSEVLAVELLRGDQRGTGTGERIEDGSVVLEN